MNDEFEGLLAFAAVILLLVPALLVKSCNAESERRLKNAVLAGDCRLVAFGGKSIDAQIPADAGEVWKCGALYYPQ